MTHSPTVHIAVPRDVGHAAHHVSGVVSSGVGHAERHVPVVGSLWQERVATHDITDEVHAKLHAAIQVIRDCCDAIDALAGQFSEHASSPNFPDATILNPLIDQVKHQLAVAEGQWRAHEDMIAPELWSQLGSSIRGAQRLVRGSQLALNDPDATALSRAQGILKIAGERRLRCQSTELPVNLGISRWELGGHALRVITAGAAVTHVAGGYDLHFPDASADPSTAQPAMSTVFAGVFAGGARTVQQRLVAASVLHVLGWTLHHVGNTAKLRFATA